MTWLDHLPFSSTEKLVAFYFRLGLSHTETLADASQPISKHSHLFVAFTVQLDAVALVIQPMPAP